MLKLPTEADGRFDLAPFISIYEDPSQRADIAFIAGLPDGQWVPNERDFIHLGFSDSAFWFRARLESEALALRDWLVYLEDPLKDEVDVYVVADGNVQQHVSARANESSASALWSTDTSFCP